MDVQTESISAPPAAAGQGAPLDVFYQAAEQAFNIVVITDDKGNVEYVNPMFTRVTGMSRGEALGRRITNLGTVFPDHAADAWKAFSQGRQWLGEFEYVNAACQQYWLLCSISPMRDPAGQITHFLGVTLNVTERKQAEEALRESEARLRALGDAIPDITMVLDGEGRYVDTLALAENSKLFYASPEAIRGRLLHDVLPRSKADLFLRVIRKTIETKRPQVLEYSLRVQAGNRWFEGRTALLTLEGQGPLVVWAARDITERKRMEAELRQMREELERKAEMQFQSRNKYGLTFREFTVLNLAVCGKPDKEIAALLGISRLTASKHVANIMKKMKTSSRTEAGVQAFRDGLID